MTRMSEPRIAYRHGAGANHATGRGSSALARPLHGRVPIRVLGPAMLLSGCVIPPSLSVDTTDAGLNSPPAIVSVRADGVELPEWSEVLFEQGPTAGTINLVVYDTDLGDTLYPKIFVDYQFADPTPPRVPCSPASGNTVQRSSTCSLATLCQMMDLGQIRTMQVVVFDREVIEGQAPYFLAMPPGGLSTSRTFTLRCQAPQ
jgi:hypothetical protein